MGQLWETIISKLNALVGGTPMRFGIPFTSIGDLQGTCEQMQRAGFARMGREQMYSGITGDQDMIYISVYQALQVNHWMVHRSLAVYFISVCGTWWLIRCMLESHFFLNVVLKRRRASKSRPGEPDGSAHGFFLFKKDPCSHSPPKAGLDKEDFALGKWKQALFSLTAACI